MPTEEEIKKKLLAQRMQEQQNAMSQAHGEAAQMKQAEDALRAVMSQILEPKARDRLNNLKMVKPDVAMQLQLYLAQLFQAGQIPTKITDEQMVTILRKLTEKRETKIRRK
jgi:programmed cell death protein 5